MRQLDCATLFPVGENDPIVPSSAMCDLAALVDSSEVVVIDNAAHSAYFEQPDEFNRCVLGLLARRARGRSPYR
jgi:3-oxoadipate enol-lactonase